MNKYLIVFSIFLIFSECNPEKKVYYFYDMENILNKYESNSMISYSTSIPVYTLWPDSTPRKISKKGYFLLHFLDDEAQYKRDTSFSKPTSFLDSINYYDSDWLKKEENLNQFWDSSMYEFGGREDTLEIYIILTIPGTDSIKLEQVHRWYKPNREG